jgi:hypothetical protein
VLSRLAPKASEFAESFSKPARLPLTGFQKWWRCAALISKDNFSSETYFPDFKTSEMLIAGFKSSRATPRHLSSNRGKDFELTRFEHLSVNSKAFGAINSV